MDTMEERTAVLRALAAGDLTVDEADARLAALDAPPLSADPRAGRSDGRRPGRPSVDEVIALAAHGVDAEFVRGLRQAGYDHLTTDEVIALVDHGVDLDNVHAFQKAGLDALTAAEMVALTDHGVEPEDIRAFLDLRRPGDADEA